MCAVVVVGGGAGLELPKQGTSQVPLNECGVYCLWLPGI
jgi:hypothetical protein